ncbi:MAG TPA: hypothetical protein VEC99_01620, partial [Clostridia bacterium]|nr:hypothetical protein [Clostridia bacterium]
LGKNTNQVVIEIHGRERFEAEPGQVSVQADGSYVSTATEVVSGQLSWTGQGLVTASSGPGSAAVCFGINSALDFLAAAAPSKEGYNDLTFILRAPADLQASDLHNSTWNMLLFETPAELIPQRDTNGYIYELKGRSNFSLQSGSMVIDGKGAITGTMDGPFTASYSYAGNGQVNVTITPTGSSPFMVPFYINAGKDLMIGLMRVLSSEDNFQQVIILVRAPAIATPQDVQGMWKLASFATPNRLVLSKDSQNLLRDVVGKDDFETGSDSVVIGHDGFFVANGGEPTIGTFSFGAGGSVTATVTNLDGGAMSYAFKLNAAKNTMMAVRSDSSRNEMLVLTKAPVVSQPRQDFGMAAVCRSGDIELFWASGVERELQASTNLVDWVPVPGTQGQHGYKAVISSPGNTFYRVAETADN